MFKKYLLLPTTIALATVNYAQGAGLELTQHGTKEMAHGFAGTATLLEDASAIAHNPAGLMLLEGRQISAGLSFVHADIDYDARFMREKVESKHGLPAYEIMGPGAGNSKELSTVPHFYYSQRISDSVAAGIGIYAPFGSGTEFPTGWSGRYHSEETQQTAVNFNPTIAFKVNDTLSLGLGVVIQKYDARLTNQLDIGYLVAEAVLETVAEQNGQAAAEAAAPTVLNNYGSKEQFQVLNEIEISSVNYGFSAGLLWQPIEPLRLGINYRSQVSHIAKGNAERSTLDLPNFQSDFINQVAADTGLSVADTTTTLNKAFDERGALGGDIVSHIYLPQLVTLSAQYELSPRLAVMSSVTYTNWSVFKEIRLEYEDRSIRGGADITDTGNDVRRRDLVQPLYFEDSWRVGLGARYEATDKTTLRAGLSFDQSPVTKAEVRTPRGPDADRTVWGVGATVHLNQEFEIDFAYGMQYIAKADVNARENPAGTQHRAAGHSKGTISNFSAQVNYRF